MNYELGMALYNIHILMLFAVLAVGYVFPKFMLFVYAPIFLYHVTFRSCPLTKIERSLHRRDITVLDPITSGFGFELTRENRQITHIALSTIFLVFLFRMYFKSP